MLAAVIRSIAQRLTRQTGWRRLCIALAAGVAAALALPPWGVWPLLVLALPVLVALIDGLSSARPAQAFLVGWAFGLGYFALAFYWIGAAFLVEADTYLWMMPFMVGGLAGAMALYWGLAVFAARLLWCGGFARLGLLAALLALAELLRGRLFTGFPWGAPGLAVDGMGALDQSAALIGMTGLTFLILLCASLPALSFGAPPGRAGRSGAALVLAALPALWAYGALRLAAEPAAPTAPAAVIRIVQPMTAQSAKWRQENRLAILETLIDLSAAPPGPLGAPTHLVWPESATPFLLAESPKALALIAERIPGDPVLITGTLNRDAAILETDGSDRIYNSVMVFAGDGRLIHTYNKWRLVPGGEFLPFAWLLEPLGFRRVVTVPGSFGSGPGPVTATVPGLGQASFLICYEAIFPHGLIDARARPAFLVNVTNDGWFGRTSGPYQHLAQARLRSIERGLPMIRAANTGISALIDARGRIIAQLPLGVSARLDASLPPALETTLYSTIGDCGVLVLIAAGIAGSWTGFGRNRKSSKA